MRRQQQQGSPTAVRPWARIDEAVLACDLSRSAFRVYIALRTYANSQQDTVHPTVARLAQRARLGERMTQYALRELESFGLVLSSKRPATDDRRGTPRQYFLPDPSASSRRHLSRAAAARAERVQQLAPIKGARIEPTRVQGLDRKGARQGILLNQIKGATSLHPEETIEETREETKEETSMSRPAKRPKKGATACTLTEEEAIRQRYIGGRYGRLVAPGG